MLSDLSPRHAPWSPEAAVETIGAHAALRGPLLPVLHALQETFGYVDPRAIPLVATALNLSRADVYGVLTFYPDLRSTLPGRVRVQVCRGEACQSVGAHALADHAAGSLGLDFGHTAADGSVTLDEVFCLGNCALGPTVTVNGQLHGRVHTAELDRLVRDNTTDTGVSDANARDAQARDQGEPPRREAHLSDPDVSGPDMHGESA